MILILRIQSPKNHRLKILTHNFCFRIHGSRAWGSWLPWQPFRWGDLQRHCVQRSLCVPRGINSPGRDRFVDIWIVSSKASLWICLSFTLSVNVVFSFRTLKLTNIAMHRKKTILRFSLRLIFHSYKLDMKWCLLT